MFDHTLLNSALKRFVFLGVVILFFLFFDSVCLHRFDKREGRACIFFGAGAMVVVCITVSMLKGGTKGLLLFGF